MKYVRVVAWHASVRVCTRNLDWKLFSAELGNYNNYTCF